MDEGSGELMWRSCGGGGETDGNWDPRGDPREEAKSQRIKKEQVLGKEAGAKLPDPETYSARIARDLSSRLDREMNSKLNSRKSSRGQQRQLQRLTAVLDRRAMEAIEHHGGDHGVATGHIYR